MDRRERRPNLQAAIQVALEQLQSDTWTAMPAIVASYNAAAQTVSCTCAIQLQVQNQQGQWNNVTVSVLEDVPVAWQGGGGFCLTFPLAKGDEGIVIFGMRCINAWWSQGGVQPQEELRMHDPSDGMFIPRLRSKGKVPPNLSTTTAQLRSDDGSTYLELAGGQIVNIVAPGGVNITGDMTVTGTLKADKITDSDGTISLYDHTHSGVQSGTDNSGPPVPGS